MNILAAAFWLAFDSGLFLLELWADTREPRPYVFRPGPLEDRWAALIDGAVQFFEDH